MKLNIGSSNPRGRYRSKEWVNIDIAPVGTFKGGVVQMDATCMGFPDNTFDEIHAVHCLEHINRNLKERFVQECYRVLKPGGKAHIEVPDFFRIVGNLLDAIRSGNSEKEHRMTTSVFGKQRYPGDQHCWGFTSLTLWKLLDEAGFRVQVDTEFMNEDKMISGHYKQEPVLLAVGTK